MLSVICESPGVLRVQHRELPVRGSGEVLLRVQRVGICGTDLHILTGGVPAVTEGRILGHEGVGVVTHRFTFDEWEQAYGTFGRAAEEKALKVVVTAS